MPDNEIVAIIIIGGSRPPPSANTTRRIMVSIPACHAGGRSSNLPGGAKFHGYETPRWSELFTRSANREDCCCRND